MISLTLFNIAAFRGDEEPWASMQHEVDDVTLFSTVSDRYRSIRQDLRVQRINSAFAAAVLEEQMRFLVIALHELCDGVMPLYAL